MLEHTPGPWADACLIEAAPDLLAACKSALTYLQWNTKDDGIPLPALLCYKLQAAINRATGIH